MQRGTMNMFECPMIHQSLESAFQCRTRERFVFVRELFCYFANHHIFHYTTIREIVFAGLDGTVLLIMLHLIYKIVPTQSFNGNSIGTHIPIYNHTNRVIDLYHLFQDFLKMTVIVTEDGWDLIRRSSQYNADDTIER